jgi:hypothetical protein
VAGSPRAKSAPIAAIISKRPAITPKKSSAAALPASPESSLDIAASAAKHWELRNNFPEFALAGVACHTVVSIQENWALCFSRAHKVGLRFTFNP